MKSIFLIFACVTVGLSGCASTAEIQREMYSQRIAEHSKIKQSEANADVSRYQAIGRLLDPQAQLAFVIGDGIAAALKAAGGGAGSQLPAMPVIEGWDDKLLKFAGILAPVAANVVGGVLQYKLGVAQTQANRDIAMGDQRARVDTIAAVAGGMGAAGANAVSSNAATAQAGYAAISNVAGAGFASASSIAASGSTAATTIATAGLATAGGIATTGLNAVRDTAGAGFTSNATIAVAGSTANTAIAASGSVAATAIAAVGFGTTRDVAGAGFAAATTLGSRVTNVTTITVTGNQNAVATQASTASVSAPTTYTNNCPGGNGSGAPSGSTGSSGNGGSTGNGGVSPSGPGGTSGTPASGTGGTGIGGAVLCTTTVDKSK